jgi:hypothetical protein
VISSDDEAFARAGIEESTEAQSLLTNLGELEPARWLISTILRHDTFHAGEINHIRGLRVEDGRWRWG